MTANRNIEINHDVDWLQDEDDNVIGYQKDPKTVVRIPSFDPLSSPAGGTVVISSAAPVNADGRPDGTIYIQTV